MGDGATRDDPGAAARGAVVVTGASTGIGRATALRLARLGFDVLAGVRRDADGERLVSDASGALTPLSLDVTEAGSIEAAAVEVERAAGAAGLRGLVNNAGVAEPGPVELLPLEDLRRQLEVNVVGQIAVTQALLPLLRRGRGRIVNVSSVGGRVSTPALGAYSASKFALEALSDSLRMELRPWGIDVVVIEPGSIRTEIWHRGEKQAESLMERLPEAQRALYAPLVAGMRRLSARTQERAIAPEHVAERIARALTTRRPRTRYVVGADARVQMALHAALPDRAYDALVRRLLGTSESGAARMG
jgi:NAD(P)-dependent dehydrogenase (short-subunit alcohol dehydrogenase family)